MASFASLGGRESGIEKEAAQFQAQRSVVVRDVYVVHELRLPTLTTVREYVSADGTVFAVTWRGPFLPDLRTLLGDHFPAFSAAAQEQKAHHVGHLPLSIRTRSLVVISVGHLRAFVGQAYLEDALPPGLPPGDIS